MELNLEILKKEFEKDCEFDNSQSAYFFSQEIEKKLNNNFEKDALGDQLKEYFKFLLKFKFLSLNMIEDWDEVVKLVSGHFNIIFEIKYYNIWNKVKANLVVVSDFEERNNKKMELKKAVLNSENLILNEKKYQNKLKFKPLIKNWMNDYIVNLGVGKIDNLKRIQYLINGENTKYLDDKDREKIKILFDFYEKIKYPSTSREGFENEIPMVVNNKFIFFEEGESKEISDDIFKMIRSIKRVEKNTGNKDKEILIKTDLNVLDKNILSTSQTSLSVKSEIKENFINNLKVAFADESQGINNSNLEQIKKLTEMAEQFLIGSLGRKAIEEEIEKLREIK